MSDFADNNLYFAHSELFNIVLRNESQSGCYLKKRLEEKVMIKQVSEITESWLLTNGYSPENLNKKGENGDSAVMKATRMGEIEIVKELIEAGADINLKNNDGNNALWFACFGNHYELITFLSEAKINIDNQNDNGATALMYAASAGKIEVLKLLLQHGANPNLKNLDDFRALDFASTIEGLKLLKNASN